METVVLENNRTNIKSVSRGSRWEDFRSEDFVFINFHDIDFEGALLNNEAKWIIVNQPSFQFVPIPNTRISVTLKNTGDIIIGQVDPSSNLSFSAETGSDSNLKEEPNISRFLASSFIHPISLLQNEKRIKEAIKEVHKVIEDLLTNKSFEIVDQILLLAQNMNFSLSILTAFLASSIDFNNVLQNRSKFFDHVEEIAIKEFGKDKLNKSIFNQLK